MTRSVKPEKPLNNAFSLIELLSVIAIMSLLMVFATPAISSLRGSGDVNGAVLNVSLVLEQARSYAMANNLHVWVGFTEEGNNLIVASVAGVTGSSDDIRSADTFRSLMRPKRFENIGLDTPDGFNGMAASAELLKASGDLQFTQTVAGAPGVKFDQVIEFGPNGGAKLASGTTFRWIQFGLKPTNASAANDAAIQVAGLTGQVQTFRR